MKVQVHVFAGLKEFFEPTFDVEMPQGASIDDLVNKLKLTNLGSAALLEKCRFAVEQNFITPGYILVSNEQIYLLPPSSGG